MASKKHVVIIGAGVTGLTSAVFLAEVGYDVTIIAAHVPGDISIEYTSPWAGADWHTTSTSNEPVQCDWDVQTYEYWSDLLQREKQEPNLPRSGIKGYELLDYWDGDPTGDFWWAPYVNNFRTLSTHTDPVRSCNARTPAGERKIMFAAAYDSFAVNVPHYLLYLQEKGRSLGVIVIKSRLPTADGLQTVLKTAEDIALVHSRPAIDCYVNATGLGAAKLCGDTSMYPIRGQTVLVKGEADCIRTHTGDFRAYCIPRPDSNTTILGGVKEVGNSSGAVDPETTKKILDHNARIVPELLTGKDGGFEVISVQCGLRPGREGGPRIEREMVGARKVVHAYGHAESGYQHSIGSARAVVTLVGGSLGGGLVSAKL